MTFRMPPMGLVLQGTGEASSPPAEPVISLTMAPASFDERRRAAIEGHYGGTANGAFLAVAHETNPTGDYLWWSQDGYNLDPGDHVAELAGWTGHEVELPAGMVTAEDRATLTRAVANAVEDWTATGTGAALELAGPISGADCFTGEDYTDRGEAGLWGHHTSAPLTNGGAFTQALAVHGTFDAGPAAPTAIGILLGTADPGDLVRVALYVGGTSTSFTGTVLVAEGTVSATDDGSGNVWAFLPLTAAQSVALVDGASIWACGKANQTGGTHPALSSMPNREDWTSRNLVIFTEAGITNDPTVAYPASLAGLEGESDIDAGNGVVLMMAIEYRQAPLVGNASLGGAGTAGILFGMHTASVLAGLESALVSPDAGGANVTVGAPLPDILGMVETYSEVAIGGTHTAQFRLAEYTGGAVGDPDGATLLADHGQTSGSSTDSWVGIVVSPEVPLPAGDVIHMALRGNGNVTVRFIGVGNEAVANPPDDPSDLATTPTDEYETNTSNAAHATSPATAYEATFSTAGVPPDLQPGNHPGRRIRFRVPGDVLTVL